MTAEPPARPVRLDGLAGHARQVSVLRRALARGTLPQTLLFSGPSAVGKGTLARMVAAALECGAPEPGACGTCLPCRKVARGIHPDVRTLEPEETEKKAASEVKVDEVRERVLRPLSLPPHEGKVLVFLVDPADALNENAQNALLKSLEEPPAYARFILVTSSPWSLLPTIRSRCQNLTFGTLPQAEMEAFLASRDIPPAGRPRLLARAGGRPGRVLAEDEKAFARERKALLDLLTFGLDPLEAPGMLAASKEIAGGNPLSLLGALSVLLADLRRVEAGLPPRVHGDAASDLAAAARSRGIEGLGALTEKLASAHGRFRHHPNPRLFWEWLFMAP